MCLVQVHCHCQMERIIMILLMNNKKLLLTCVCNNERTDKILGKNMYYMLPRNENIVTRSAKNIQTLFPALLFILQLLFSLDLSPTIFLSKSTVQEIGCNHAESVGFSTYGFGTTLTITKLHLIWVTTRIHIEIYKYPAS